MADDPSINELIDVMNEVGEGDARVGRIYNGFVVPGKALDSTVVSVALSKLAETPMIPSDAYQPTILEPGRYDITVLIHIKRVGDIDTLLN